MKCWYQYYDDSYIALDSNMINECKSQAELVANVDELLAALMSIPPNPNFKYIEFLPLSQGYNQDWNSFVACLVYRIHQLHPSVVGVKVTLTIFFNGQDVLKEIMTVNPFITDWIFKGNYSSYGVFARAMIYDNMHRLRKLIITDQCYRTDSSASMAVHTLAKNLLCFQFVNLRYLSVNFAVVEGLDWRAIQLANFAMLHFNDDAGEHPFERNIRLHQIAAKCSLTFLLCVKANRSRVAIIGKDVARIIAKLLLKQCSEPIHLKALHDTLLKTDVNYASEFAHYQ